ncbi:ATP-binding cassette domain-containing protein [Tepidimicrobium xylanilyticum]|uniref:ABC-type multidrug transport system, ATPase component n=1 Tax=Tepidimicrobium xylanilyticum TaxID=1123352 RepID=A0A1H3DDU2_9FIRM|nr:ATP-binding cassette domain-containing protein [Tepidimicrobium xylanilyticum]GMG97383.1 ABC transporter ATP-binding protein [Tepidimicrobium xylanilyticum]SDX64490.1 ABC-type multidrug transport system, ATPase component [Tepidimicrobium xylanilyticum]
MGNRLSVSNIKFYYFNKEVLSGITFEHDDNGIIALLGPNGAGKTTLMRILVGLKKAKTGNVYYNGEDLLNNRNKLIKAVGYLPQNFEIYSNVSGLDFLSYVCDVKMLNEKEKKDNIEFVVEKFNLERVIKKRFGSYSGGYKRRLGIAQAMIGNPQFIIIDEPTAGLDPEQRFEFRQYLTNIGKDKIVLISTHIVEDIAFYCSKVIILNEGKITFDGTPDELIGLVDGKIYGGTINVEEYGTLKGQLNIIEQSGMEDGKISLKVICEDKAPHGFKKIKPTLENAYVYFQKG